MYFKKKKINYELIFNQKLKYESFMDDELF